MSSASVDENISDVAATDVAYEGVPWLDFQGISEAIKDGIDDKGVRFRYVGPLSGEWNWKIGDTVKQWTMLPDGSKRGWVEQPDEAFSVYNYTGLVRVYE